MSRMFKGTIHFEHSKSEKNIRLKATLFMKRQCIFNTFSCSFFYITLLGCSSKYEYNNMRYVHIFLKCTPPHTHTHIPFNTLPMYTHRAAVLRDTYSVIALQIAVEEVICI